MCWACVWCCVCGFSQCVVTCGISYLLGEYGARQGAKDFWRQFPVVRVDTAKCMQIMPLSLVFVGMVMFNNICLKYVEVSFYNVARSLTLVFNVILSYLWMGETTSPRVLLTLLIIILGFIVGIDGEVNFSLLGTSAGVVSSLFVALNSIFTAKMLPLADNDKGKLLFINNCNASALFLPLIFLFEWDVLVLHSAKLFDMVFWTLMCVSGVFGFLIGLVTVMQVQATSALTHNISGTAKAAAQSILAFYVWGNEMTFNAMMGIVLVLGGSFLYTYAKFLQNDKAKARPSKSISPRPKEQV